MTDEERNALLNFNFFMYYKDFTDFYYADAEIIYKLIEKQQAEIEEYKKANNYLQERLNEKPENPQYERMERLRLQAEIEKKDKIIDLIAETISNINKGKTFIENNTDKEKIIEYFTNKVKGGK